MIFRISKIHRNISQKFISKFKGPYQIILRNNCCIITNTILTDTDTKLSDIINQKLYHKTILLETKFARKSREGSEVMRTLTLIKVYSL